MRDFHLAGHLYGMGKKAEVHSDVIILDFILQYIFWINLKHFPFTLVSRSFCHKPLSQTMSKACLKSINAQCNLLLYTFESSKRLCNINKLSVVEKAFRKPAWQDSISPISSIYLLSRAFKIAVNYFPKQLSRVIGR